MPSADQLLRSKHIKEATRALANDIRAEIAKVKQVKDVCTPPPSDDNRPSRCVDSEELQRELDLVKLEERSQLARNRLRSLREEVTASLRSICSK